MKNIYVLKGMSVADRDGKFLIIFLPTLYLEAIKSLTSCTYETIRGTGTSAAEFC